VIEPVRGSPDRLRLLNNSWRSLARKINPTWSRLTLRTRFLYWLDGHVQSILYGLQEKSYSDKLATTIPSAPIFVLGFWRSGTTLLHELLCCDSRFGYPTTYACLNPAHFLLSEAWIRARAQRQVRRPMDNLLYSWASPQEDEFALLALGAPSAYEALLVPSLMQNTEPLLDLASRSQEDRDLWRQTFRYFLKLLTVQQGKTMVLKSPTHGYRMPILQEEFPEARYVVIERNPYEVFASNLKLWQVLTDRYGLERRSQNAIEEFILNAYLLHEHAIAEGRSHAAPGSMACVRYENLEKEPVAQIHRLYDELNLGVFEIVRPRLEQYLAKVSGHVRNRFRLSRTQKLRVDQRWGELIKVKGYEWPSAYVELE
jgi:omega-hydroxy-beta-dihydromenaquinone-9 sulfotransferase